MAKRINNTFYNIDYYSCVPIRKLDEDTKIQGNLLFYVTEEKLEKTKENFPDVEIYKNQSIFDDANGTEYFIVFPNKIRKDLKSFLEKMDIGLKYPDYLYTKHSLPEGYLFSGWKTGRKTKIKANDLPDSFIRCYNYKKNGYVQTAGVKDILYKPSPFHNHSFKDDFVFLSYKDGKTIQKDGTWYNNYDEYIFGNDIVNVIFGVEKHSPEMKEKIDVIKKEMVKQHNAYVKEVGEWSCSKEISVLEELL